LGAPSVALQFLLRNPGLVVGGNFVRPDFVNHSRFSRSVEGILFLPHVSFRQLIDMLISAFLSDFHHLAQNRKIAIGIVGVENRQGDTTVTPQIFIFDPAGGRIDEIYAPSKSIHTGVTCGRPSLMLVAK
jgi:hypothetical protein